MPRHPSRPSLLLAAACAVLLHGACSSATDENEPNDDPARAQLLSPGETVRGTVAAAGDKDWYRVDVPDRKRAGEALHLVLRHPAGADLRLVVEKNRKDARGKLVDDWGPVRAESGRKKAPRGEMVTEEFLPISLVPGEWLIRVEAAPQAPRASYPATYTLELRVETRAEYSESEPNDTADDATPIEPGIPYEGFLSPGSSPFSADGREYDWYKLELDVSNRAVIDVEVSGVPGCDIVLGYYDARRRLVKEANANGDNLGERLDKLGVDGKETLYFRVTTKRPYETNPAIPYSLRATVRERRPGSELEPNDERAQANPLEFNSEVAGTLAPAGDADWYVVRVPQPGSWILTGRVKGVPEVDLALEVRDAAGRGLQVFNGAGPGEPEFIANLGLRTAGYDQPVYVQVRAASGHNPRDEYQLTLSLHEASQLGEFEPNDDRGAANPLVPGVDKKGFLYPAGDRDWYSFTLAGRRLVQLRVNGVPGLDLVARLVDGKGAVARSVDGAGQGEGESFGTELAAGTWYLVVAAKGAAEANAREPYTVRIALRAPRDGERATD